MKLINQDQKCSSECMLIYDLFSYGAMALGSTRTTSAVISVCSMKFMAALMNALLQAVEYIVNSEFFHTV